MIEFIIHREPLYKLLSRAIPLIERRSTMPILGNVLLRAEDDKVHISATDSEIALISFTEAQVASGGSLAVNGKKLHEIVRELPDQVILFREMSNQRLKIECGKSRFTLSTLPATDYPELPKPQGTVQFKMNTKLLHGLLNRTHFAISADEGRYALNGLFVELEPMEEGEGSFLRCVATDTHRLAWIEEKLALTIPETMGVVLPKKGVSEFKKLLEEDESEVEVIIGQTHMQLVKPTVTMISKLVDGKFPNYRKILEGESNFYAHIDKVGMIASVRRMAVISHEKSHGINLTFQPDVMHITTNNPEQEDADETVDITYTGPEMTLGFNARYLLEFLSIIESDVVILGLDDAELAVRAKDSCCENYLCLLMPMQV